MTVADRRLLLIAITMLVTGNAIALHFFLARQEDRYVIINADDAGMYHSVNAATTHAMNNGPVSSCSIMVPCPGFREFVAYALSNPRKDFGIHLVLTCDADTNRWGPVAPREAVRSLVDQNGYFWRTRRQLATNAKISEVELELRAQIEALQSTGIRPSHLDHHMFALFERPDFLQMYVQLAVEYDLPIRFTHEPSAADLDTNDEALLQAFRDGLSKLQRANLPILDKCESRSYFVPVETKMDYYLDVLTRLPPGVSEILVHCAYNTPGLAVAPDAAQREVEAQVICSPEFAAALRRNGLQVITWNDYMAMRR